MSNHDHSFLDVWDFLTSYRSSPQRLEAAFPIISHFLLNGAETLRNPAALIAVDSQPSNIATSFALRGKTYEVTSSQKVKASKLSQDLHFEFQECLRIVSQVDSRLSCNFEQEHLHTEYVLRERNSLLNILLILLNGHAELPAEADQLIATIIGDKDKFCLNLIDAISKLLEATIRDQRGVEDDDNTNLQTKSTYATLYIAVGIEIIATIIFNYNCPFNVTTRWLELMKTSDYLLIFADAMKIPSDSRDRLMALSTVCTLLFLGLDASSPAINSHADFFVHPSHFVSINQFFLEQPKNPIVNYYWSYVLSLQSYLCEEYPDENLDFVGKVFGSTPITSIIATLILKANEFSFLDCLTSQVTAVADDKIWSVVLMAFVTLSLNFLPFSDLVTSAIETSLKCVPPKFIEDFLIYPEFERKFSVVRAKVPLINEGLLPMIHLTSLNPDFANIEWKELNTYTENLTLSALSYDLADSDEVTDESDLIVLKKEHFVKPPLELDSNTFVLIPENTKGKIVPTADDNSGEVKAVVFLYSYNGWSMLGRLLSNLCKTYHQFKETDEKEKNSELLIAIIGLISSVVGAEVPRTRSAEIVSHLSANISEDDIFATIFGLFEVALNARDIPILCACLRLMIRLTSSFPQMVWGHLVRSDLTDKNGKEGLAVIILGSTELPAGNFEFSALLISLVNQLVTDSMSVDQMFPERIKSEILLKLTAHLIQIYESYQYWRFLDQNQMIEIGISLTSLISRVLYTVYGINSSFSSDKGPGKVLKGSADCIVSHFFASQSPDVRAVNSLKNIIKASLKTGSINGKSVNLKKLTRLVTKSFDLASLLISLRPLLRLKLSTLELVLFSTSSHMVDLYCSRHEVRNDVIRLLTYLVSVPFAEDVPSLLAHMGPEKAETLSSSLASDLRNPLTGDALLQNIYTFFSAVMDGRQDGLAVLFLTGRVVSGSKSDDSKLRSAKSSNTSLLEILKETAMKLDSLPKPVASQLLDAIAFAFNKWNAARDPQKDKSLITFLLKKLESFKPLSAPIGAKDTAAFADLLNDFKLVSRLAEILALCLYTSSPADPSTYAVLKSTQLATIVKPYFNLQSLDEDSVELLEKKFEQQWPNLQLDMFLKSPLLSSTNQRFIFNFDLMDHYFSCDEKWSGTNDRNGFRSELLEVSSKLQLKAYRIAAAKSWGALLSAFIKKTPTPLESTFIDIAESFLAQNASSDKENLQTDELYLECSELSFYILYSLLKTSVKVPQKRLQSLLLNLMDTVKSERVNFLQSIVSYSKSTAYRPILRCVLIVCSLFKSQCEIFENISDEILEFLEATVARGVSLILSELLAKINASLAEGVEPVIANISEKIQDLSLLLSLLTHFKALRPPDSFNLILASILDNAGTLKAVLNLYSCSHLMKINREPVLSDLALSFILEFCSVDYVAEKLVSNGLFTVILESPVSLAIQKGGITPQGNPRLHHIWNKGLICAILQLLSLFGTNLLPECCLFVSFFGEQIKTTITSWSGDSLAISNALIQETIQVVLLQKMFRALDYRDFLADSTGQSKTSSEVEAIQLFFGLDSKQERKEFNATLDHLLTHPKFLSSRIIPTTLEEQRLLEQEPTRAQFSKSITESIRQLQAALTSDNWIE
ncbi:LAMI_0A05094g1_1 [Lachancea mirantina]|uniref:Nucleoporin NUP188 n=1 Tax=Lachancea mirantina TaxID=1230905 RepID=A0A1G4IPG7_9SACH|nr:LAMI_0A05094g1_1 [Lachancea mirantina]